MSDQPAVILVDFDAPPKEVARDFLRVAFPDRVDLFPDSGEPLLLLSRFDDEVWTPLNRILRSFECSAETKEEIFHILRLEAWNQIGELLAPNVVRFVAAPSANRGTDD